MRGHAVLDLELIAVGRFPYLGRENLGFVVLHYAVHPCGDAFAPASVPIDMEFVEVLVVHGIEGKDDFPDAAVVDFREGVILAFLPIVKFAHQVDLGSIGSPLTENPLGPFLVKTEIEVAGSHLNARSSF